MSEGRPPVGISQCLTGAAVRYDGGHQFSPLCDALAPWLDFRPLCPEAGIGLGTPREPIHLRRQADGRVHAVGRDDGRRDVTGALRHYAAQQAGTLDALCGHILMQRSPSCGLGSVKLHDADGVLLPAAGTGVYTHALMERHPLLPLAEEAALHDGDALDHFLTRVFARWRWQHLHDDLSLAALQDFHLRYKYLLMASHQPTYRELGRLLADAGTDTPADTARRYFPVFTAALARPLDRGNHANALQHMAGYLKRQLTPGERQALQTAITAYQQGRQPRQAVTDLLRHHLEQHPQPYLQRQAYLFPYPPALMAPVRAQARAPLGAPG